MSAANELHIPIRVINDGRGPDRTWKARCSCQKWGPPAADPTAAELALARSHDALEPKSGCALCGQLTPPSDDDERPPWRRYRPVEGPAGAWEYVCVNGAECAQRQLGQEHQLTHGDPWLVSRRRDGEDLFVSLDVDITQAPADVAGAIAMYQLAQAECPRDWDEITGSARDRRALAGRVVALAALLEAAESHQWHAVLAARKSGVSWRHLSELLTEEPAVLRGGLLEFYEYRDWPWSGRQTPADIQLLLAEDDPAT